MFRDLLLHDVRVSDLRGLLKPSLVIDHFCAQLEGTGFTC